MAPGCFLTPGSAFDSGSAGHAVVGAGLAEPVPGGRPPACAAAVGAPLPATLLSSAPDLDFLHLLEGVRLDPAWAETSVAAQLQNAAALARTRPAQARALVVEVAALVRMAEQLRARLAARKGAAACSCPPAGGHFSCACAAGCAAGGGAAAAVAGCGDACAAAPSHKRGALDAFGSVNGGISITGSSGSDCGTGWDACGGGGAAKRARPAALDMPPPAPRPPPPPRAAAAAAASTAAADNAAAAAGAVPVAADGDGKGAAGAARPALGVWQGRLLHRRAGAVAELASLAVQLPLPYPSQLPAALDATDLAPRRTVRLGRHVVARCALLAATTARQLSALAALARAQVVAVVPLPQGELVVVPYFDGRAHVRVVAFLRLQGGRG
ncbi:hypothetical protein Rsub_12082 [Raphidocelis subcapitata]|uniref:Uncharacterized protein n=1 Tax=Raphidocelis subcapitata TaxID=307507 RepID=A0A2V0PHK2_9CHLO|nr:hypothetical protein Rsub_12082 [Raphidocelis subcapitata]|eukprot:GBF99301.1 hypothetical protein Rsub_12082 [Raphidocelis subcapitata]